MEIKVVYNLYIEMEEYKKRKKVKIKMPFCVNTNPFYRKHGDITQKCRQIHETILTYRDTQCICHAPLLPFIHVSYNSFSLY